MNTPKRRSAAILKCLSVNEVMTYLDRFREPASDPEADRLYREIIEAENRRGYHDEFKGDAIRRTREAYTNYLKERQRQRDIERVKNAGK